MKYQQQADLNDCGPACLVMIASHYRSFISIGMARRLCKTDAMGTNFTGLVAGACELGFKASALQGEVSDASLNAKLLFPFIAHIKISFSRRISEHYVVIKKITKRFIVIWDPNPQEGIHRISRQEFLAMWTGYVLIITPDSHFIPQKGQENILIKFLPLLLPHRKTLVFISLASFLMIIFGIATSFYYKYVIDEIIVSKAEFTLTALSVGVLLITITQVIVETLRRILINHFAYKTDLRLNFSYITHILKLPISFFETRRTGEIISRLYDVGKIRTALSSTILSIILDVILLLVIGPILFNINRVMFVVLCINIFFMGIIIGIFTKLFRKYYIRLRNEEAIANSILVEIIGGAYTMKALNAEKVLFDEYEKNQMLAVWTSWKAGIISILQGLFISLTSSVSGIIVYWIGSSAILQDTLSIGTLISFNALSGYFTGPLSRLVTVQASLQEASIATERISEILEIEPEQQTGKKWLMPPAFEGTIDVSHVAFKYGTRHQVYKNLSFHIDKGQWVGFVGPSGCGKTSLIKLLLKFYLPDEGTILLDGYDITDIDAVTLRSRIGYVPQDIHIFSGTIAENIAIHNQNISLEEITIASRNAGADEFIRKLPERYNTRLSERGLTLSGGERQRIALARALLTKPDIMIFDEATSNLDSISEKAVHQTIQKLQGSITTILIAHRLATVKDCDVIFVMDKGEILESGSHTELLIQNSLYKSLWENMTV